MVVTGTSQIKIRFITEPISGHRAVLSIHILTSARGLAGTLQVS